MGNSSAVIGRICLGIFAKSVDQNGFWFKSGGVIETLYDDVHTFTEKCKIFPVVPTPRF